VQQPADCHNFTLAITQFEICDLLPKVLPTINDAESIHKQIIDFIGGPGRTRTSNQAVMSELAALSKKRLLAADEV
ncbi:MAG: hypothetical protein WB677_27060, partial [Xanthobacteraceae bacterium]